MRAKAPVTEGAIGHQRSLPVRWQLATLAAVLIVCAGLRIWLIVHTEIISADGTLYIQMAQRWPHDPQGTIDSFDHHPGYPALVATLHPLVAALGGPRGGAGWDLTGQIVSLVACLGAIAGVWVLAAKAFGHRVAWMTALLLGAGRKWAIVGSDVLSDAPSVCLQIWAIVLALSVLNLLRRNSKWAILLAAAVGLCAGGGYLVRPDALLAGVLAVLLWLWYLARKQVKWPATLAAVGATAMAAMACAAPYMLAIGQLSKKKKLSDLLPMSSTWTDLLPLANASSQPQVAALQKVVSQLFEAMHPVLAFAALIWLITWIGFGVLRLKLPQRVSIAPSRPMGFVMLAATVIIAPLMMGLYSKVGYLSHRHLLFLAALLAPLGGAGVVVLGGWLATIVTKFRRLAKPDTWACPLIAAAMLVPMLGHSSRPLHKDRMCYRQAGQFLASIAGQGDSLITDNVWVRHYARMPGSQLPPGVEDIATLTSPLRQTAATYLALTDETPAMTNGSLRAILQPPAFSPLGQFTNAAGKRIRTVDLYRINLAELAD